VIIKSCFFVLMLTVALGILAQTKENRVCDCLSFRAHGVGSAAPPIFSVSDSNEILVSKMVVH
jgi:hypothetical protein